MSAQSWSGKRVLVTGVSGFVGPYLARDLLEKRADVYGLLRTRSDRTFSRGLVDHSLTTEIQFREADVEDLYGVLRICGGGPAGRGLSPGGPVTRKIDTAENLMEVARRHPRCAGRP